MIIARGGVGERELILLGLSRANVEKLLAGQTMRINRSTHGGGVPEGWEILITFGETEQAIAAELRSAGIVGDETHVYVDPRLKS